MKKYKNQEDADFELAIEKLHSLTEKIDAGDMRKYISFRNDFNISDTGGRFTHTVEDIAQTIPRDIWERELFAREQKYEEFQKNIRVLASDIGIKDNELTSFEDFLITGIISYQKSSMRIKSEINHATGKQAVWLRIDGLSISEIMEELALIKKSYPTTISTEYKPTRIANYTLHKKVYAMHSRGMKPRDIVKKLTDDVYQAQKVLKTYNNSMPGKVNIPSANYVSQIIKRFENAKKKKHDKLKK